VTHERARLIREILDEALTREGVERTAFLDERCAHDPALRREIDDALARSDSSAPAGGGDGSSSEAEGLTFSAPTAEGRAPDGLAESEPPPKQLGHYQIVSLLGRGGMGEVYRCRDPRLARDVAIKTLPGDVARDPDRLSRFRREARALAAVNHPGIAAIHGLEESAGHTFLVLELVEGETLAERLERSGPVPLDESLKIAAQVADALDSAHARGIAHRDVKPANIKITPEGRAKVLDFGLAKSAEGSPLDLALSAVPTAVTAVGQVVGTPAYMSPEQARGQAVDHRTDIWAFGCVLFELLSGSRPFRGANLPDLMTAVVSRQPDWSLLPARTPERVRAVLRRCLEKDVARRMAALGEARAEIERVQAGRRGVSRRAVVTTVALGVVAAVAGAIALNTGGLRDRLAGLAGGPRIRSIAVLPLRNATGDPAQEYFSDGMTESLIAGLAKIGSMKVISRTSVQRYKNSDKSVQAVASELGVDAVLEGSVRRASGHVFLDVTLFDGRSDLSLWGESYDRELADALILQSDIARDVARQIHVKLTPRDESRLAAVRRVDPEAHDLYVQGWSHLTRLTPAELDTALKYFELARAKEPALGWAGIAAVWGTRAQFGFASPTEALPKARAAALEALKRNDNLFEVHLVLALIKARADWDWQGAKIEFQRALDLKPNDAEAYAQYARVEAILGNPAEAVKMGAKALELEPFRPIFQAMQALNLADAGRYEDALALAKKAIAQQPTLARNAAGVLARALFGLQRYEDLFGAYRSSFEAQGDREVVASLDRGHAAEGYRRGLHLGADTLAARVGTGNGHVDPVPIEEMYQYAGDGERALDWMEYMLAQHDPNTPAAAMLAVTDEVRDSPRFRAIRERVGLPPL
jgi:TolB-like protein